MGPGRASGGTRHSSDPEHFWVGGIWNMSVFGLAQNGHWNRTLKSILNRVIVLPFLLYVLRMHSPHLARQRYAVPSYRR